MRLALLASATCLSLVALCAVSAPDTTPPEPTAPNAPVNGDAAAKHAKRTACLKDAKDRKLVGADKSTFLKSCIGNPPAAT